MQTENTDYRPENMSTDGLKELAADMLHRMNVHETLWLRETEHQLGLENALAIMDKAWASTREISKKRIEKELSEININAFYASNTDLVNTTDDSAMPDPASVTGKEMLNICEVIAKNWLAQDGVWFQAIEENYGMNEAKRCNDSVWARFSPFEAWSVKRLLGLSDNPGLAGLKTALGFRMYGRLNVQSCRFADENTLIFEMNECRVQAARLRKGLADYPCKSAGLVEYSRFAKQIDSRIKTECIGCPPDEHPSEWACAWKFYI